MKSNIPTAEKPKDKEGRRSMIPSPEFIRAFLLYETPRCRNCGRPLKAEKSRKIGFGPTCAMDFAARWIKREPAYMGERAKKIWSPEEVAALLKHVKVMKGG